MKAMTDQDKEYLRDLFAGFAMMGIVSRGINDEVVEKVAENAYVMADAMIEARDKKEIYAEKGITAIKKRTATRKMD
jgi:hypothetical protein